MVVLEATEFPIRTIKVFGGFLSKSSNIDTKIKIISVTIRISHSSGVVVPIDHNRQVSNIQHCPIPGNWLT